jgi:ParB family chromosome partitioning protein
MAHGNRGFAQGLAGGGQGSAAERRLPPRTGILQSRENRLAELAAGTTVSRVHELVDPAKCRIWPGHNRDYAALDETSCADLIESFKAQGRQEVPAIVRRLGPESEHAYEVICGARRHWTVSWMRAHDRPDFKFLIEPRELTDEEAFRLADLENRNRRDLSDYERACDYARALDRYYEGSQQRMAERLEVSKSWLSRYLELARLPSQVTAAFGSPHDIGISHGALLAPLLRRPEQQERLVAEAVSLADEQAALKRRAQPPIRPAMVARRLAEAAQRSRQRARARSEVREVRDAAGALLARGERAVRGGRVTITVPAPAKSSRKDLLSAIEEIIDELSQRTPQTDA